MEYTSERIKNWLKNVSPLFQSDENKYKELISEISESQAVFVPCSSLDIKSVLLLEKTTFREHAGDFSPCERIYFMCDTAQTVADELKRLYLSENCGVPLPEDWPYSEYSRYMKVLSIVPMRLFDEAYLQNCLRGNPDDYIGRENLTDEISVMVTSEWNSWVQDDWHCVYLKCEAAGKYVRLFVLPMDNIIAWREVIERFSVPVTYMTVFCEASGGWGWQCREGAPFFNVVKNSKSELRPKLWTDNRYSEYLPESWERICRDAAFDIGDGEKIYNIDALKACWDD